MIIGENFTPILAESRHMGCVSFAKQFFPQGEISQLHFENARQAALMKIEDLAYEYRHLGWDVVLGSSGTIKTVHQVIMANIDPNGLITPERLQQLIKQTLQHTHFEDLKLSGLIEERADVFVPGLAILSAVFETFGIQQMRYSDGALREGVMYSLEKTFQVSNIRERTALGLAEQFTIDQAQAERVHQSVKLLSQQYRHWKKPQLAAEMIEIVLWAARLHEVGIVINHKGMQKHSAYILQNIELPGFDKEQQRLLATLVRYQINLFKLSELSKFARYDEQDVLALVRLLRLAIILNKSRQATEKTEQITLTFNRALTHWTLKFAQGYLTHTPLICNELKAEKRVLNEMGLDITFN